MDKKYDYLVVGAGIYGATFANLASTNGKKVLVIDKKPHIGGNLYDEDYKGILVHKYGTHIFHTDYHEVWAYLNMFTKFNDYRHTVVAKHYDTTYSMPFNMYTFCTAFGQYGDTPEKAKGIIERERNLYGVKEPKNLEEQAISLVGFNIFNLLVKDYTEKQWNRSCKELPPSIIKRLPLRFTFDNRYFSDKYQGMPIGGFTKMINKMLDGCEVVLNEDFLGKKDYYLSIADKVIYTGPIDEFFDYTLGTLEYRGLRFENEEIQCNDYQGTSVINLCDKTEKYTRTIEHKHLYFGDDKPYTYITREYPADWKRGDIPYYPINNEKNNTLYQQYVEYAKENANNVIFAGRLGSYKYYDIDDAVKEAMTLYSNLEKSGE